jgi:hypothetical protein
MVTSPGPEAAAAATVPALAAGLAVTGLAVTRLAVVGPVAGPWRRPDRRRGLRLFRLQRLAPGDGDS